MRLEFHGPRARPRQGARYRKIQVSLDGAEIGYIEGLEETYVIHLTTGGEVGPYPSLEAAKKAVRAGLQAGVLGTGKG